MCRRWNNTPLLPLPSQRSVTHFPAPIHCDLEEDCPILHILPVTEILVLFSLNGGLLSLYFLCTIPLMLNFLPPPVDLHFSLPNLSHLYHSHLNPRMEGI